MQPRDVFEILAREHGPMLLVYLHSAVRDEQRVDDLFQETMLVAWRRLDTFDRSKPFGPWLRGIATRLIMADRRQQHRAAALLSEAVLEHLQERMCQLEAVPGDTLDDRLNHLRCCLEELTEEERQSVQLRYEHRLSREDMATRLHATAEAVKKRLQRARVRLRICLGRKLTAAEGGR